MHCWNVYTMLFDIHVYVHKTIVRYGIIIILLKSHYTVDSVDDVYHCNTCVQQVQVRSLMFNCGTEKNYLSTFLS